MEGGKSLSLRFLKKLLCLLISSLAIMQSAGTLIPSFLWCLLPLWKEVLISVVLLPQCYLGMGLFLLIVLGALLDSPSGNPCALGKLKKICVIISPPISPLLYFSNFFQLDVGSCTLIPCIVFKSDFFSF